MSCQTRACTLSGVCSVGYASVFAASQCMRCFLVAANAWDSPPIQVKIVRQEQGCTRSCGLVAITASASQAALASQGKSPQVVVGSSHLKRIN